jgi:hypothetical protein
MYVTHRSRRVTIVVQSRTAMKVYPRERGDLPSLLAHFQEKKLNAFLTGDGITVYGDYPPTLEAEGFYQVLQFTQGWFSERFNGDVSLYKDGRIVPLSGTAVVAVPLYEIGDIDTLRQAFSHLTIELQQTLEFMMVRGSPAFTQADLETIVYQVMQQQNKE